MKGIKNILIMMLIVFVFVVASSVSLIPTFGYGITIASVNTPMGEKRFFVNDYSVKAVGDTLDTVDGTVQTPYGEYFSHFEAVDNGNIVYRVLVAPEGVFYVVELVTYDPPGYRVLAEKGAQRVNNAEKWLVKDTEEKNTIRAVTSLPTPLKITNYSTGGIHPMLVIDVDEFLKSLEGLMPTLSCKSDARYVLDEKSLRVFPITGQDEENNYTQHTGILVSASEDEIRTLLEQLVARSCNKTVSLSGDLYLKIPLMEVSFNLYKNGSPIYPYTVGNAKDIRDFTPTEGTFFRHRFVKALDTVRAYFGNDYVNVVSGIISSFWSYSGIQWTVDDNKSLVVKGGQVDMGIEPFKGYVGAGWNRLSAVPGADINRSAIGGMPIYFAEPAHNTDITYRAKGTLRVYIGYKTSSVTSSVIGSGYITLDYRFYMPGR